MHQLLLSLLAFCPATLAERQGYTVCYDTQHQRPLWTKHEVGPSAAPTQRRHWRIDRELNSLPSSAFTNSGFDRGHFATAADLPNSADTFLTSNAVPQNPKLNRGAWRRLENDIRKVPGSTVVTGAIYNNCGNEKIEAPCQIFKIAFLPNGEIVAAFYHNAEKIERQ